MNMLKLKITHKIKITVLLLISIISIAFVATNSSDFEIIKNLDIYHSLVKEINLYYVDNPDPGKLVKTSIDAMLKSLDPYTMYIPEADMEDYKFQTTGQYGGVGAVIQTKNGKVTITEPYEGSPIQKAGLKAGDVIIEIDGQSVKDKNGDEVSKALKGQPKTNVKLLIKRPGTENTFEKTIDRENIQIKSVPYFGIIEENIGYIKLNSFTENCSQEVKTAFTELKEKQQIKSVVIDLRDNPGGLLIEAVHIVNLFVKKGEEIVSTKGRVEQWNKTFKTVYAPTDLEIPVIVLVNRMSASASEIVSGALQDLDRAVIIGQKTYGKGLVQTTRSLSYNSKLKVTTAKYYIPSGRCIQALDYSHRNPDGSVGKIPDSLITKFSTRNNRPVFDGGGIMPDIATTDDIYSNITLSLAQNDFIFDFVTQFVIKNDSISTPEKFVVTDQLYDEFISYLETKKFEYQTDRDKALQNLIEIAKKEKYYQTSEAEFENLKKKLAHNTRNDLLLFKDEISKIMLEEICSRFYYQSGRIRAELANDVHVKECVKILKDRNKYDSMLKNPSK
jgi:carboxyl-terminal processing protease